MSIQNLREFFIMRLPDSLASFRRLLPLLCLAGAISACGQGGRTLSGSAANLPAVAPANHAADATVSLKVSPDSHDTFATFAIWYFKVSCEWSDGIPDPDCSDAGTPQWQTSYGWFEPDRKGTLERTAMLVMPTDQRPQDWTGQSVLWSSDFSVDEAQSGTITVSYAGASAQVPVTADAFSNAPGNWLLDHPSHPGTSPAGIQSHLQWQNQQGNDIKSPDYQQAQINEAVGVSDRLTAFIKDWSQGSRAPAPVPESVFGHVEGDDRSGSWLLHSEWDWQIVRPEDFDPFEHLFMRPGFKDFDAETALGVTHLFPDINSTYLRMTYVAPFDSTLVINGVYPRARYHSYGASPPFDPAYPAGTSVGAPEIPFLDVDMVPDPGSINPYRVYRDSNPGGSGACAAFKHGDRSAPNECRRYTLRFEHRMGNAFTLNEELNPGSMEEEVTNALRTCLEDDPQNCAGSNNTRIAGGLRSGAAGSLGELLPGQLWVRAYLPDHGTDLWGDAPLPRLHMEQVIDGQLVEYMIVPRRSVAEPQRDLITRLLNGPWPLDLWQTFTQEPWETRWDESIGWKKVWGIFRSVAEDVNISKHPLAVLATKSVVRDVDRRSFGRGVDEGLTGALEASATTAPAIHYTNRFLAIGRGSVGVVFARKPRAPETEDGQRFMTGGDIRYFSITRYPLLHTPGTYGPIGLPTVSAGNLGTIFDEELIAIDRGSACDDWFMLVYSRREDRPMNATTENFVTWRNWTDRSDQDLVTRYFTIGPDWEADWTPSTKNMTWEDSDWGEPTFDQSQMWFNTQSDTVMGEHHLMVAYLSKEEFEALGPDVSPQDLLPFTRNWGGPPPTGHLGDLEPATVDDLLVGPPTTIITPPPALVGECAADTGPLPLR